MKSDSQVDHEHQQQEIDQEQSMLELDQSIAHREQARADHDQARINLAIHLSDRGQVTAALQQLTLAETINPLNAEAFANHAAVLQRAGRNEEALEKLARAAELNPPKYRPLCRAMLRSLQPKVR